MGELVFVQDNAMYTNTTIYDLWTRKHGFHIPDVCPPGSYDLNLADCKI